MTHRRIAIGRAGERHALDHLQRSGFMLVEANARTRYGEIDLIMREGRLLVFCEVKTSTGSTTTMWESIGMRKQRRIRSLAVSWLADRRDLNVPINAVRFDAIGVQLSPRGELRSLNHLRGAF